MKTYHFTSNQFTGHVELTYTDEGRLTGYNIHAQLSALQHDFFVRSTPPTLTEFKQLLKDHESKATLTEVKQELTFDLFWNRYNEKIRSSKKKTLKLWERMPKAEQLKAFNFITRYEQSLLPGVAKKYAETYLNAELWNN